MESRSERLRKQKHRRKSKGAAWKKLLGLTAAGVACLSIGVFAAYLTTNSDKAGLEQAQEELVIPTATAAPKPKPAASAKPSAQPESDQAAKPSPQATVKEPSAGASAGASGRVELAFVGDVLLGSKVEDIMKKNGYDYPYSNVKALLSDPDYTIANLETPVTTRGEQQTKEYAYRSPPEAIPALKASGIDLVNLANNHTLDFGVQGLTDTMDALDKNGLAHVGAGMNKDEAYRPVIVEKMGIRIAFLGFSRVLPESWWKAGDSNPGLAETYNYVLPVEAVKQARQQADLVVVIAHWGVERSDSPDASQTEMAHRYIDAGADLVVASHPHVLQGFEAYKGKWIAYSLGNFIFTTNDVPKTWETAVLQASCSKERDCDLTVVPVWTKSALPTPMNAEDGAKLFQRLSGISINAQVQQDGRVVGR
ncbi:CapA family protein [Paenibacillus athensensis]|uniref:CapA family protein n=1 Tax=Paenibacillus athensensis TaxID=1967502 RepID=UPI001E36A6DA|nr:CapA family protein [Paenibacillus athensensis]